MVIDRLERHNGSLERSMMIASKYKDDLAKIPQMDSGLWSWSQEDGDQVVAQE